jgi:hypothetical protein
VKVYHHLLEILFAVSFCALCASAVDVLAADWSFTPSATLSESYDSNFRFVTTPLRGETKYDFITSFTPVVSINGETEQTKFNFDTTTPAQAYINNPRFDIVNTNTVAGLTETWSPRFSTTATLGFVHDQTIEEQLQASGIVAQRTEHYQYNSGLGCTYGLNENLSLLVSGAYSKNDYPSGTVPDSDLYQATISPTWSIDERNNISLVNSLSSTDYSASTTTGNASKIDSLTEMLSFQRLFSDTLSMKLGGGYYFSTLDFTAFTPKIIGFKIVPPDRLVPNIILIPRPESATEGGFVFSADVKKDWTERLSTSFSAGRQQYNDVNTNSFNSTFVSGGAAYKWSELTTVSFSARYNMNSQIAGGTQEFDYYNFIFSVERNLTENFILRLSASYELEYENSGGPGATTQSPDRYRTWVDLTYKWPRFFASH